MSREAEKKSLVKIVIMIMLVMLIPVIPFVVLGDQFELQMESWLKAQQGSSEVFWLTILLLGVDIFLPIPSSGICTFAGGVLGFAGGTIASFTGLSVGCVAGFFLARIFGEGIVKKYTSKDDYELIKRFAERYGLQLVALTRPLPILAEATVLVMGAGKLSWSRFLVSMLTSNLILAMIYAGLGVWFKDANSLPWAILASVLIPVALTYLARFYFPRGGDEELQQTSRTV